MVTRMTKAQWQARGEAYEEAAQHLLMSWTDDAIEWSQGEIVSKRLMIEAKVCFERALGCVPGRRSEP